MTPTENHVVPQQDWTNITRAEANKILTMVAQRVADASEELITYCLILTGDITRSAA